MTTRRPLRRDPQRVWWRLRREGGEVVGGRRRRRPKGGSDQRRRDRAARAAAESSASRCARRPARRDEPAGPRTRGRPNIPCEPLLARVGSPRANDQAGTVLIPLTLLVLRRLRARHDTSASATSWSVATPPPSVPRGARPARPAGCASPPARYLSSSTHGQASDEFWNGRPARRGGCVTPSQSGAPPSPYRSPASFSYRAHAPLQSRRGRRSPPGRNGDGHLTPGRQGPLSPVRIKCRGQARASPVITIKTRGSDEFRKLGVLGPTIGQ